MEKSVSFKISGMHCKACAKIISDAFSEIEGIRNVRVDFASEKASFLADTKKASFSRVKEVLSELGYGYVRKPESEEEPKETTPEAKPVPAMAPAKEFKQPKTGVLEKNVSLKISGMQCNVCAKRISDALSGIEGIENVKVDFALEKASFIANTEKVSFRRVKEVLSELGYGVKKPESGAKPVPAMAPANGLRQPKTGAKPKSSLKQGIVYGLIPHIGCIGFVAASILGVTFAVELFKPLLMNPWFFYILIAISLIFATISTMFYLNRNGILSTKGIMRKKKYIGTMYASTVAINLLFFLVIFPLTANFAVAGPANNATGAFALNDAGDSGLSKITLAVQIPCSGHAPLISGELKKLPGISGITFSPPNLFEVSYDPAKVTKQQILGLEVFKTYPATVTKESTAPAKANLQAAGGSARGSCGISPSPAGSGTSGGGSSTSPGSGTSGTATANTVASLAGIGETKYSQGTGTGPGYQTINMDVVAGGYSPDVFVLKAGVPVKWVINGKEVTGCNGTIIVPAYNLNFRVAQGEQTINFTPEKTGTIDWSCGMGMIRGQFIVLDDVSVDSTGKVIADAQTQQQIASAPPKSGGSCGGGGCGCGGAR